MPGEPRPAKTLELYVTCLRARARGHPQTCKAATPFVPAWDREASGQPLKPRASQRA